MNKNELIIYTAIILFIAFLIGFFANWLLGRMSRVSPEDIGELDKMAQALHDAEENRDEAIAYLHQREADLTNQVNQAQAELSATMDALRGARHEVEELRAHLSQ